MPIERPANGCGNGSGSAERGGSAILPVNPFHAPRYHFGMLLGVDDFETEQAYHRGKLRLHNAWLHGEGVVWGMDVDLPEVDGSPGTRRGEVRVLAGLALDGAGRELRLDASACVGLGAWYRAHRDDPELRAVVRDEGNGTVAFDAHVVACFRACLARPVPSISAPCEGAGGDVAYSRAHETVELRLVPGRAPARREPYHRLRLLFGIAAPRTDDDGEPLDADREVLQVRDADPPLGADALLAAFRAFAALDEIDLAPAAVAEHGESSLFPAPEDRCVVLANVTDVTLHDADGDVPEFGDATVDVRVRPSHVATSTLQELLVAALRRGGPAPAPAAADGDAEADAPPAAPDAGGPRIDPTSVTIRGERIEMTASPRVAPGSLSPEAFSVTNYDRNDGWHELEIATPRLDDDDPSKIVLHLKHAGRGSLFRVIARGTGPRPLMGLRDVPLAGARGGPPGTADDGHDFVCMVKLPSTRRKG